MNCKASAITLQTASEPVALSLSDIVSTELARLSLVPEGLLKGLDATQRRNLVACLVGEE
jgi:hypothetical protein